MVVLHYYSGFSAAEIAGILGIPGGTARSRLHYATEAMRAALEAPTIDPAKIEQIRAAEMKIADDSSKRFTKALTDAGNVLNANQRQAFFKMWNERQGNRRG